MDLCSAVVGLTKWMWSAVLQKVRLVYVLFIKRWFSAISFYVAAHMKAVTHSYEQ